jgi:hypothetical protein
MTWHFEELRRDYEYEWTTAPVCVFKPECIFLKHGLAILPTMGLSLKVSALVHKFLASRWVPR